MSRNKALSQLQKAYDESYLISSTAVYYESQGDEQDAARCWRSALEHIRQHQNSRVLFSTGVRSETETALVSSIKELELQCKERIDLLEALRLSRQENLGRDFSTNGELEKAQPEPPVREVQRREAEQSSIPVFEYSSPSKPCLPPRPAPTSRLSSDSAARINAELKADELVHKGSLQRLADTTSTSKSDKSLTGVSIPEKHRLRTTLRMGRGTKNSRSPNRSRPEVAEGSSRAANMAWSTLNSQEEQQRGQRLHSPTGPPMIANPRTLSDQSRKFATASNIQWDSHCRRLVVQESADTASGSLTPRAEHTAQRPSTLSVSAASSALNTPSSYGQGQTEWPSAIDRPSRIKSVPPVIPQLGAPKSATAIVNAVQNSRRAKDIPFSRPNNRKIDAHSLIEQSPLGTYNSGPGTSQLVSGERRRNLGSTATLSASPDVDSGKEKGDAENDGHRAKQKAATLAHPSLVDPDTRPQSGFSVNWQERKASLLKNLPTGIDELAAKQILSEIVVQGDEVHWSDIAGLEAAKLALRETVVYPFLRPDLFMGLREPARGMLLFGPPGTGKTMLARAVATESNSTFFSISASSLTSKYLGDSEKLVRALFAVARALAPSIIFVDEIDSLLSQRAGSGEHETTRRIKTEFLIQWSNLQRAAAGREISPERKECGDATRVLVLAATNLPWLIDEAARRRFVRRQYIPLPEPGTRAAQVRKLLRQQNHTLSEEDIEKLVDLTNGFSGSDITALAKDAAMGPLRSLGEALLNMTPNDIRPIELADFQASLETIRPSVNMAGLKEYEDWAKQFGERGG